MWRYFIPKCLKLFSFFNSTYSCACYCSSWDSFIHTTPLHSLSYARILSNESSSKGQHIATLFTELSCLPRVLDPCFLSSPRGSVVCTAGPEGICIKACIRPAMLKGTLLPLSNLLLSPALTLRGVYIKLNVRLFSSAVSWVIVLVLPG